MLCSIAGSIKDTLGLDLNGFLDWLGFSFDWENIKKTQKVGFIMQRIVCLC